MGAKKRKMKKSAEETLTPRERQDLLEAGLYQTRKKINYELQKQEKSETKQDKAKKDESSNSTAQEPAEMNFATKLLGSSDSKIRHNAIFKLRQYLKIRCTPPQPHEGSESSTSNTTTGGISYLELQKLWKGLWHGLYMCDKVPVQHELSKQMAELIWCLCGTDSANDIAKGNDYLQLEVDMEKKRRLMEEIKDDDDDKEDDEEEEEDADMEANEDFMTLTESLLQDGNKKHYRGSELVSLFVRCFFETVRREWDKMDRHRVDKFYTIIRLVLSEVYKYIGSRSYNVGTIHMFNDNVFQTILAPDTNTYFPNGVRCHIIDICVEELARSSQQNDTGLTNEGFVDTLEPFLAMAQSEADKMVHGRVMENVLERFLMNYSVVRLDHDNGDEDALCMDQVHVGTVAQFIFDLASDGQTLDRYRDSLYDMHKMYVRRIKAVGFDVALDEDEPDTEEEPPISQEPQEEDAQEAEIPETKKDKKKKKKHKRKHEKTEDEQSNHDNSKDDAKEEDVKPTDAALKSKKKKKKKKEKREDKQVTAATDDDKESHEVIDSLQNLPPQQKEEEPDTKPQDEPAETTDDASSKKKKKKKNKKKSKKKDEIVISVKEQNEAAKAAVVQFKVESPSTPSPTRKQSKNEASTKTPSPHKRPPTPFNRRVSFGKVNRSKSHKASVNALVNAVPPAPYCTPEKGILAKKPKHSSSKKGKPPRDGSSRKKSSDWY